MDERIDTKLYIISPPEMGEVDQGYKMMSKKDFYFL